MPFMFFDPTTMVLLIPALVFALWAQAKVSSTYAKFSRVGNRAGLTGADVAQLILKDADISVPQAWGEARGAQTCNIERIGGRLTDHYDPRSRTLRLSQDVYNGNSVAALGIAAHEVGHAIQHAQMYAPLMARNFIYPVCSVGSTLAFPLFFLGFFTGIGPLVKLGIILFSVAVAFTVLTLPVEFDASRRALLALSRGGYLSEDELRGAKRVLSAAAMTYVAAVAMAIMQLVRMLVIADRD